MDMGNICAYMVIIKAGVFIGHSNVPSVAEELDI